MDVKSGVKLGGVYRVVCRDKFGNFKWEDFAPNIVVNQGLDYILDAGLSGGTPITTWYVGLKNSGSGAAGDTLASHAGWTENTAYTGTRKAWTEAGVSSQSITNSASPASFAINTNGQSIAGLFMCSVTSGTSGTLFNVADFASAKSVDDGDTLNVTYTVSAADDGV